MTNSTTTTLPPELLLSLPPNMCRQLAACEPRIAQRAFASHDPPHKQLGSGGGTAHLLVEAWRQAGGSSFRDWIANGRRIAIHGGGECRRLPAYAAVGKLFIPMPVLRWSRGQRLDQTLLDLQEPFLQGVFARAGRSTRLMIGSGDVLLRAAEPIRRLPDVDVVLLGMWTTPEFAQDFGVMFCDRHQPQNLLCFLQKPDPDEIRERSRHSIFLIDVGVWLLSAKAVQSLMAKCGWAAEAERFRGGDHPEAYDLYGQWALHLGCDPEIRDDDISPLRVAVVPLRQGEFYHFGETSDVIDSMYSLQNVVTDQTALGPVPSLAQPRQFIQNSEFGVPLRREENESLWVENSCIPSSWKLANRHVLTGIPDNDWSLQLAAGTCLDFVPVGEHEIAVRGYGFADSFRGQLGDEATRWQAMPLSKWLSDRDMTWDEAGLAPTMDMQRAPLFPVLERGALAPGFIQWLVGPYPGDTEAVAHKQRWLDARRLTARDLAQTANLRRVYEQRRTFRNRVLPVMAGHGVNSVFYKLDLSHVARQYAASGCPLVPPSQVDEAGELMLAVHDRMFRSAVLREHDDPDWQQWEAEAFQLLERAIVSRYKQSPVRPHCRIAEDQIVWGRSPARVDLAGGWTDTPPYCIEQGGSVTNIAVNLNGQPPIQVFARKSKQLHLTIRSIDLGISEQLDSYEDVAAYRELESGFSVARACWALAGFHPDFNGGIYETLAEQLRDFGGGLDISMLAAVPKGSGLGTSSILAGTLLGVLSELCGLGWDLQETCARVSAVEQMLGSGGGWQDQFGGLMPGGKIIETQAGIEQRPAIRWLPGDFFSPRGLGGRTLLYYTGITRVAHDLLGEIVRGMFLNDAGRLDVLDRIGANGRLCFDAAQRWHEEDFCDAVQRSWELNQALDSGTNPPEVDEIVRCVEPHICALKLAGAGGGGFMFMIAKDEQQALAVRRKLEAAPPNDRARFVEMSLSDTGLQITRS